MSISGQQDVGYKGVATGRDQVMLGISMPRGCHEGDMGNYNNLTSGYQEQIEVIKNENGEWKVSDTAKIGLLPDELESYGPTVNQEIVDYRESNE